MRFCHFLGVCLFFASLGKSPVVASWQSDFCLLFKFIKIFSDLLGMGAVHMLLAQVLNSNLIFE